MKNYSYPRVVTSVTALARSSRRPEPEDTTVLFVPIIGKTGPAKELVKIHSLEEFRSTFGIDTRMGRTLLNISNWLTAGGTLYTYRLLRPSETVTTNNGTTEGDSGTTTTTHVYSKKSEANFKGSNAETSAPIFATVSSKYDGGFLNDYTVVLSLSGNLLTLKLLDENNVTRERIVLTLDFKSATFNANTHVAKFDIDLTKRSEYLSEINIEILKIPGASDNPDKYVFNTSITTDQYLAKQKMENGTDGWADEGKKTAYETALEYFWGTAGKSELEAAIGNRLETPIDLIMDAGYPVAIKKEMIKLISHFDTLGEVDALRPDIRGYFDLADISDGIDGRTSTIEAIESALGFGEGKNSYKETANIFIFDQKFTISEETYFDEDMEVYPSYFLSSMIPANDLLNGVQYPLAGKRRAELEGIKKISYNPSPDEKEALFTKRINYVEKDSRGYYFMSQRTFDGSSEEKYTALSFINNSRTTCKMVHELEEIGRNYLFEFNDAATLANMSAAMNRYVTNWIANRTLSFGSVEVSADPYSDERVNAVLNIKFTGTIEVISIDLYLH